MRAAVLVLALAGCTPEIVSGSYHCGPDATCPETLVCNGPDNICVGRGTSMPFACDPDVATEPDDTPETGYEVELRCGSIGSVLDNCMFADDTSDWVRFVAPSLCGEISFEARVTYPTAFAQIGMELWDLAANERVAQDTECLNSGAAGEDLRCMEKPLVPGKTYGVHVLQTGDGDCDGTCAYNRYALRMQLNAP